MGFYPVENGEILGRRRKQSHLLRGLWRTVERKAFKRLFQLPWVGQKSAIKMGNSEGSLCGAQEATSAAFGKG